MDHITAVTTAPSRVLYTVRWKDGHDSLETRRTVRIYHPEILERFDLAQAGYVRPDTPIPPPPYLDSTPPYLSNLDQLVVAADHLQLRERIASTNVLPLEAYSICDAATLRASAAGNAGRQLSG